MARQVKKPKLYEPVCPGLQPTGGMLERTHLKNYSLNGVHPALARDPCAPDLLDAVRWRGE
jgi:hypothetical protein